MSPARKSCRAFLLSTRQKTRQVIPPPGLPRWRSRKFDLPQRGLFCGVEHLVFNEIQWDNYRSDFAS